MGQYWEMVAHERGETLGNWGKAGEFVPSLSPSEIIHLIAVPVAVDVNAGTSASGDAGSGSPAAHQSLQHSRLLQLPIEIILLITEKLDLNSLYTLTHCCRLLRGILHTEVHTRFRNSLAPWANTPLMCAGDYIRSNPPGITTVVPESFTPPSAGKHVPIEEYSRLTAYHLMQLMNPTNVVISSTTCLSPPTLNPIPPEEPYSWLRNKLPWQRILKLSKYFPPGRHWVLRNLTAREYVYAHVLTSQDGHGGGLDSPDAQHKWGFTLGTVVAVNTCWSDDPSASMSGLEVFGEWAGDCFDIVEEERLLQDQAGGRVWVDVSYSTWEAMVCMFRQNRWDAPEDSDDEE